MPQIALKKNWGAATKEMSPMMLRGLDEAYTDLANAIITKISKRVVDGVSPPANDPINSLFEIGDIWVRTDTNQAWIMTSRTTNEAVNWQIIT